MSITSQGTGGGQILAAATTTGAAVASLPATGGHPVSLALVVTAGAIGVIVLASFVITRVLKLVL